MAYDSIEINFFNKLIKDFGGYINLSKNYIMTNKNVFTKDHGKYSFVHQEELRVGIDKCGTFIITNTLVELDKELTVIPNYKPFFKANKHEKRIIREKLEWKH